MTAYFLDSSALVKRYISETGSAWVQQITAPQTGNLSQSETHSSPEQRQHSLDYLLVAYGRKRLGLLPK